MLRAALWPLALMLMAAPTSAKTTDDYPMALSIDDRPSIEVTKGAEIRRAVARCRPPGSCASIGLEREPQIMYVANYERRGYTIEHRLGPPGPQMLARRRGKGDPT